LIIIARLLTTEDVGVYSLALAVTAPLTLFFNMKMKAIVVTEDYINIGQYKHVRSFLNIISFVVVIIVTMIFYSQYLYVFIYVAAMKILDIQSEFYQSIPQRNKNFKVPSYLMVTKNTLIIITFSLLVIYTDNLSIALFGVVLTQILHLSVERSYFNKNIIKKNDESQNSVKKIFLMLIPLGFVQMLYSFGANIPKYLLDIYESVELVGVFSAVFYLFTLINLLMTSLSQTLLPYARIIFNKDKRRFLRMVNYDAGIAIAGFGILLFLFTNLFGETILRIIYGEEFVVSVLVLNFLVFSVVFNMLSWVYDATLLIFRFIQLQPYLTFINIVITTLLSMLLIRQYGLLGASISIFIYNFLNYILKFFYLNIKISNYRRKGLKYDTFE
jgi:O-antigen/teichoic acid export membrane protein